MTAIAVDQSKVLETKGTVWGATLLVSGTCIGGGMLAMPVQAAETGFILSALALFISWAFMTYSGLLLVEATLWVQNNTHYSSLSRFLVGSSIKILAIGVYLFMNYASLVGYTAGGVALINMWLKSLLGFSISYEWACILFTIALGFIVNSGAQALSRVNNIFVFLMVALFFGLVAACFGIVKADHLAFRPAWTHWVNVFPIILAAFSYQMIVPSVCSYLKYDAAQLKKAIILGTSIPCLVYMLWLFVIHGSVPLDGSNSLREAFARGASATMSLREQITHWSFTLSADIFCFIALVTSYLGLSFALFDFLRDCFRELKIYIGRKAILLCTLIPTATFAIFFPRALLQCLDISGGFGDTILSGLIPISMVAVGRYRKKLTGSFKIPGGKVALAIASAFFLCILVQQIVQLFR